MKNEDISEGLLMAFLTVIVVFIGLVTLDGLGRLTRLLYAEWPYISLGGLIVCICFLGYLFCSHIYRIQYAFEQEQKKKLDSFENKIISIEHRYEQFEKRITETSNRVSDHTVLCQFTLKKVDDLLAQKSPITNLVSSNDPSVMEAVTEITGGRS